MQVETFAALSAVKPQEVEVPSNIDWSWTGQGHDKHRDD